MKKYKDALYPDKANDFIDNDGNFLTDVAGKMAPLTEDPLEPNPTNNLFVVALSEEPAKRYDGYLYAIGLRYFPINWIITHGTISYQPETIKETEEVEFYIIPDEDYNLPKSIIVIGVEEFTYNPETGYVLLSNPTENVRVTINCPILVYLDFNVTHGISDAPESFEYNPQDIILITVTPALNCRLPRDITSYSGADVSWMTVGSKTQVSIRNVTGRFVTVNVDCDFKPTISTNINHGSLRQTPSNFWNTSPQTVYFSPSTGYGYPDTVTITGVEGVNYNANSGVLQWTKATNDIISITADCVQLVPVVGHIENGYLESNSGVKPNGTITLSTYGNDHYLQPIITSVTGARDYTINNGYITINGVADGAVSVDVYGSAAYGSKFTANGYNCSVYFSIEGGYDSSTLVVEPGTTVTASIQDLDYGYTYPDSVNVTGATDYNYDSSTGTITFYEYGDDVSVEASAKSSGCYVYFDSIDGGYVKDANYDEDLYEGFYDFGTHYWKIVPYDGNKLPDSIHVYKNSDEDHDAENSYDSSTGQFTITFSDGDENCSIECECPELTS